MAKTSTQIRQEMAMTRSRIDQDIEMLQDRLRQGADLQRIAEHYTAVMVVGSFVTVLFLAGLFLNRRSQGSD